MKILLTGGTGGIGRAVLAEIDRRNREYQAGIRVRNLTRRPDLPPPHFCFGLDIDEQVVVEAIEEWLPDVIIHLAAKSTIKEDGNPCAITESNTLLTHRLLHHAPEGCRFVFASSATVYGKNASMTTASEITPLRPDSAYAATKIAGEALVEAYTRMGRVRGVSLRLVANCGPGGTHGLVNDVVRKLRSDSPTLDLIGDAPGSCKPLCHVGDTANALLYFAFRGDAFPLNVSPPDSITVERVAEVSMEELGIRKPINWLGWAENWPGDCPEVRIDAGLSARAGFRYRYGSSEEALRAALKDIREEAACAG